MFSRDMSSYDMIRDAILTCARKPTWVNLIYRTWLSTIEQNCQPSEATSDHPWAWSVGHLLNDIEHRLSFVTQSFVSHRDPTFYDRRICYALYCVVATVIVYNWILDEDGCLGTEVVRHACCYVMACKCCFVLVLVAVFYEWEAERGPLSGWELIERVDGFHPNQVCAPMISSGNQRTT